MKIRWIGDMITCCEMVEVIHGTLSVASNGSGCCRRCLLLGSLINRLERCVSVEAKVPRDQRLTPEEIRETIVDLVVASPGISQRSIVNELGIDDDTVGYHLRTMVEQGDLRTGKEGRHAVYFRDT